MYSLIYKVVKIKEIPLGVTKDCWKLVVGRRCRGYENSE